tara:strand:+ start:385 stop:915 length:531 start_codon:yes stop_codon:yes gene_type:complete
MAIYYGDGTNSNGSTTGGRIVQCITAHKNGHTSHTGQSWSSNVGGLTASITMSDSNNKVLIIWNVSFSAAANVYSGQVRLVRDGTVKGAGTLGAANQVASNNHYFTSYDSYSSFTFSNMSNGYIDNPGSGTHTYALQVRSGYSGYAVYVNRTYNNSNNNHEGSASSFITLFEIAHS